MQKTASGQAVGMSMQDILVRILPLLNFALALAAIFITLAPRPEQKPQWHQMIERTVLEHTTDLSPAVLEKRGFLDTLGNIGKSILDGITGGGSNSSSSGGIGGIFDQILGGIVNGTGNLIQGPAGFLGVGLGAGVAAGLGTNKQAVDAAVNNSIAILGLKADGINPTIQNAAMGLASSLVGSLTAKNSTDDASTAPASGNISFLGLDIPQAALGLGQGLGGGAASGLKLTTTNGKVQNSSDIAGIANNLAFGLANSLLADLNFTALGQLLGPTPDLSGLLAEIVAPAATGLGNGIGEGVAIGLGVQQDSNKLVSPPQTNSTLPFNVGATAEGFAKGLTSRFLQGGTLSKIIDDPSIITGSNSSSSSSSSSNPLGDIDLGKVANGLVRGLIQGAADSVIAVGGIDSLVAGNATLPQQPPNTTLDFNDGVGGAATGFGMGLGGQGVLAAVQLLEKGGSNAAGGKRSVITETGLEPRQASVTPTAGGGLNLSVVLSADAISTIGQTAVDTLQCQGIGGVLLVLDNVFGQTSNQNTTLPDSVKQVLQQVIPKGVIQIRSDSNVYDVDGTKVTNAIIDGNGSILNAAKVNNMDVVTFAVIMALHIIISIAVFFFALPAVVGLESLVQTTQKKTTTAWFAGIVPMTVLVLVFGFVIGAKGTQHFATAHGPLGFLTGLGALAIGIIRFMSRNKPEMTAKFQAPIPRNIANLVLMIMTLATVFTGFGDLSGVVLCFTQTIPFTTAMGLGLLLGFAFVLGISANILDLAITLRDSRKKQGQVPIGISSVEKGAAMNQQTRPVSNGSGMSGLNYGAEKPSPVVPRPGMPPFRIVAGGAQDVLDDRIFRGN